MFNDIKQADLNKIDPTTVKKFTALINRDGVDVRVVCELNENAASRVQVNQSEKVLAVYRSDVAPSEKSFQDLSVEGEGTHLLIFFTNGTVTEMSRENLTAQMLVKYTGTIFSLSHDQDTEDKERYERNRSKMGPYANSEDGCPNCGRDRVMVGDDGKHRCEKCAWCIEDNEYDSEFSYYLK